MLVTMMVFIILTFCWQLFCGMAMHNTLVEIRKNTSMPSDINVGGKRG